MLIGIISDTHDNVDSILKSVEFFKEKKVDYVIHCGDIVAPVTIKFFKGIKTMFINGNCKGSDEKNKQFAEEIGGSFHGDLLKYTESGKKIVAYHGHDKKKLSNLIESGDFDFVLTGHTHKQRNELIGKTRVINPGAHYYGSDHSIAILNIDNSDVKFINLGGEK